MPINQQINLLLNEFSVFELERPTGPNKILIYSFRDATLHHTHYL